MPLQEQTTKSELKRYSAFLSLAGITDKKRIKAGCSILAKLEKEAYERGQQKAREEARKDERDKIITGIKDMIEDLEWSKSAFKNFEEKYL